VITQEQARKRVEEYLLALKPARFDNPRVVWDEQTEEYPGCWVYFWVLKKYLETKDRQYRIGGNYPIIVDKNDGSMYATGFRPVEEYVEIFKTDRSRLERLSG
jgi:hypothetical protein